MQRWQTFSLFALSKLVCTKKCYLKIWHLLFVPYRTYTNHEGDSLFLPFCTIKISMYQKSTLAYTLFLTYLPQAYSPLERSGLSSCLFHHPLFPKFFFFPLSTRGSARRRNSAGLAKLWGGWPIELVIYILLYVSFRKLTHTTSSSKVTQHKTGKPKT